MDAEVNAVVQRAYLSLLICEGPCHSSIGHRDACRLAVLTATTPLVTQYHDTIISAVVESAHSSGAGLKVLDKALIVKIAEVGVPVVASKAESVTRMARSYRPLASVKRKPGATKEMEGTPGKPGTLAWHSGSR